MSNVIDSVHLWPVMDHLVRIFTPTVVVWRCGDRVETLTLVALCLARTTTATHDTAAKCTTGMTRRIIRASQDRFVFTSRETFLDLDTADDLVQVVALVARADSIWF